MRSFDFGANWEDYSSHSLDDSRLAAAIHSLQSLVDRPNLTGSSVLDIGCGSGLFSIAAARMGASRVVGIDINPVCVEVSERNKEKFGATPKVGFEICSALDPDGLNALGTFDLVYAWGSLHHTGAMWEAIELAAQRVSSGGLFVLAIYNQHLTSPIWRSIKKNYNRLPVSGKKIVAIIFAPVILVAKLLVTGQNPLRKERGMSFWFDVIDWLGGYPYEFASPDEVKAFVAELGFREQSFKSAQVPTGCNEFVFQKNYRN